jgi:two-component system, chemotaxis family, CheB/CheR fusion protein
MLEVNPKYQLVVIGCSAGGLAALSTLVSTLHTPFPAPIVIAQHLDPERPSLLTEILSLRSSLPVRPLSGSTMLENGTIYVVPPGHNVGILDHHIRLLADDDMRHRTSIDELFRAAADAYGENTIAVVLTGTGVDGAAGADHVKRCGGTVIVENPQTASFPGMPDAPASSSVDVVSDLERIGGILYELLTGVYVDPPPDEEKRLQTLLELVRDRNGIDFRKYKQATILRRLRSRIASTDTGNLERYMGYLDEHPEEFARLTNSFLIKVTEFMRDPELFTYLAETVLPELVAHARQQNKALRLWSAGCATGEEAYSLAILVGEILGDELDDFNVRIFATDIDADAIAFARRGVYASSALDDLPREIVERYFVPTDGRYQIKKRLRNLTVFGEHDLGARAPFPNIDLVMCRNVLIYFTGELQNRALQLFAFSLREDGYLVLGKAETTNPLGHFFAPHDLQRKVFVRRGERALVPPPVLPAPLPKRVLRTRPTPLPLPLRVPAQASRTRLPIDALLSSLPFGAVLVDSRYDILEINLAARRLLGIHGPAIGEDFVHLAQAIPHRKLLAVVDAAIRGETPDPIESALESVPAGETCYLQVSCHPQRAETELSKVDCALILVHDVTLAVKMRLETERQLAREATARAELARVVAGAEAHEAALEAENERLRRLSDERAAALEGAEVERQQDRIVAGQLSEANRELLRANELLTEAHEQLRAENEELLLSREEAQAATEEVETLNEEFQATNEELETVNEELQSTNEELNTTNADLEARSREIQELATAAEGERARLAAILRSMADGLLVVDGAGRPVLTNDAYHEMFGEGRAPLFDVKGQPLPFEETPEQRAARGEKFHMEFSLSSTRGARRYLEATANPIASSSAPGIEGGVVVVRDISERSVRKLQERFTAMASHELRTPLVPLHGYLDMLLHLLPEHGNGQGHSSDERARRFAKLARSQAERLERLVDDLVSATRIQTGKFQLKLEPVELGPLVERAAESAQLMSKKVTIHVDMPPAISASTRVNGDAARLEQVMMNLLGNAIHHADGTSRIDVRLRRAAENEVELEVEDYGRGIPADDLPHLFSSFYQVEHPNSTPRGGMGLGLFICKEIVAAHAGQMSVRSAEGKGTAFTVRLPLMPDEGACGRGITP